MKEITIDYALRETWLTVAKMYNEEAKANNNTMAMGFTLLSIDPKTGSPSTALGPKMGMEATSLSRILKSLEAKAFICRKPNPNDGRGVIIHLTKLGLEKRTQSKDAVLQFNNVIKNNISEEKLNHFFEVTEAINTLIGKKKIFQKK
tara:strand:- start:350 stop:790 length:441 start_codon:yes stop_codon:yes gene_type:complete